MSYHDVCSQSIFLSDILLAKEKQSEQTSGDVDQVAYSRKSIFVISQDILNKTTTALARKATIRQYDTRKHQRMYTLKPSEKDLI